MLTGPANEWPVELQFYDEGLLVCAQGSQSLMLLELDSGEPLWTIDRLWEYQRRYIGPSVWRHLVDRFGMDEDELAHPERFTKEGKPYYEERKRRFDQRQRAFRESYRGSFVAGPFIVREQNPSEKYPSPRLLVVTSIAPRDPWSGQLSQQYVYEIGSFHRVCSMIPLPRNVYGWAASVDGDQVTLACAEGAWARFSTTLNGSDFGPGKSPDSVAGLLWYRVHVPQQRSAWMVCDPVRDAADVDPILGVRIAGGGWIENKDEELFHFPLWIVDPRSGAAQEAELLVPFEGRMTPPKEGSKRGEANRVWGWRGLGLTTIWLTNGQLSFWLANDSQTWRVDFDATALAALR
jgi:hypothetical protein